MFTKINSGGIRGIEGFFVSVEADVSNGLPAFSISGQLASEVREAQERVRTALKNSGFQLPAKKITVNLSPAGVKKGGTAFDLPIAVAVLGAFGVLDIRQLEDSMIIGELGLDGTVKPVTGILVQTAAARDRGLKRCFLPEENRTEGILAEGIEVIGVRSLAQMAELLNGRKVGVFGETGWTENEASKKVLTQFRENMLVPDKAYDVDFKEINGQGVLRRAAEVAAAGLHGLVMCGRAGPGQ
ncbi:magnesium chelatase domain-containing protein, partial [Enterocloster sp.]|uniref:magnesium chelatase domain-containing protein n=1 Tax=Enterocloster sp. TaxID=2719315 RepID=UPI00399FE070